MMASVHGSPALRQCTKLLMPGIIECIAKIAASEQADFPELHTQIIAEAYKAFAALFAATSDDRSAYQALAASRTSF